MKEMHLRPALAALVPSLCNNFTFAECKNRWCFRLQIYLYSSKSPSRLPPFSIVVGANLSAQWEQPSGLEATGHFCFKRRFI